MPEPVIDMRSDTKTLPTPAMRQAMAAADVGDDMCGEDPTVNRLEAMVAEIFAKPAAVYACSGSQSNQMGIRAHCQPGDEILIDESSHVANYEAGGPAVLSGATCRTLRGDHGMLDVDLLEGKIRGNDAHCCRTRLVSLENTTNAGGGRAYPIEQIERVSAWARDHDVKVHLDGARLFNAVTAQDYSPVDIGALVDTVSICFSKGLGCPMGSILVGSDEEIYLARRSRKLFGGALRQAGIVAAAAIYALENHVDRLANDHANARAFADAIVDVDGIVIDPVDVETNLVFFEVDPEQGTPDQLVAALRDRGVLMGASGPKRIRACTHLDITREQALDAAEAVRECIGAGTKKMPVSS